MFKRLSILVFTVLLASCNVSRVVKPLEKGEKQLSASFGGPGIVFSGIPLPMPLSSVGYAQGIDTGLTVSAGLHTTSLLFGVAQLDAGLHIQLFENKAQNFGMTAAPALNLFYDFNAGNMRTYPQIDLLGWWKYLDEKQHFFYAGGGTWVELEREKAHEQVQNHEIMPYITFGHQFNREKWSFQIEARYIGMNYRNDKLVVDYLTPFNKGTSGIYVGINRKLVK
ncbi:MAG: hypothetical protein WEC59_03235 [Salibacteraceae bacterium]